jgi:hypothetical protein
MYMLSLRGRDVPAWVNYNKKEKKCNIRQHSMAWHALVSYDKDRVRAGEADSFK